MPDRIVPVHYKIRAYLRASFGHGVVENTFEELALELFHAQIEANPAYRQLCQFRGIGEIQNWMDIPAVPTVAFKELEMTAIPKSDRERVFYSSGTTQSDRSRHFHFKDSVAIYEQSLWTWFAETFHDRISGRRWIFLTPPSRLAENSSLAHMFQTIASKLKDGFEFFGTVDSGGGWTLNVPSVIRTLQHCAREDQGVVLLGTAFQFVQLIDELNRAKTRIELPAKSWIMETGGYKGRSREMPKEELRGSLGECLGIKNGEIFGEYGMSELSSQAYDRADGVFRFPPWARARIISPQTGREVADGERGLIRVFDLANIWSVMAVQTEDLGMKIGNGFELAGRAAQAEARGCSLMSV